MKTIGTKIKLLRGKMSQETLADKLGIASRTLGSIESGETKKIDFLLMDKICKIFDVDSDYFKDETQINKVKTNQGTIAHTVGTINLCPEDIINHIKLLIEDNRSKDITIIDKDRIIEEKDIMIKVLIAKIELK